MYEHDCPYYYRRPRRQYGCLNFLFDVFMFLITHGLWLIWIFVREARRNRPRY